jgi:hypothetical protein
VINVTNKIIARLVEAVQTGEHCGTSDTGPRRVAAISIRGFGLLTKHGLLAEAMRQVSEIETPHPRAQQRFLDVWTKRGVLFRELTCDDSAFFAGLRVLLPAYEGPPITLYRGQLAGDPLGVSWTCDYIVAVKFALYGCASIPNNSDLSKPIKGHTPRRNGILVRATPHPSQIISAPCLHGHREGEYVVDPRWLRDYEIDEGERNDVETGASVVQDQTVQA